MTQQCVETVMLLYEPPIPRPEVTMPPKSRGPKPAPLPRTSLYSSPPPTKTWSLTVDHRADHDSLRSLRLFHGSHVGPVADFCKSAFSALEEAQVSQIS